VTTQSCLCSLFRSVALACAATLLFASHGLTQQPPQVLYNHVRSAVSSGQAALLGPLDPALRLNLSIVLPLRNQDELTSLLARLSNPSSPDYRQFLSAQQFTDRFGPTPSDYQAVINFVIANGFTVTDQPANRLIVPINGTVAQIEHAFNLSMNVYQHPTEQRQFFSPDREPTLNLSVPVKHIAGMDNFSIPRPVSTQAPGGLSIPSTTGSGPGGSFLASDMRAAYYGVGGTTLTGAGQCVGLAEFVGYDIADVNLTFSSVQQSYTVPVNNVLVDNASPGPVNNYDAEQVLDIVQSIGMAPGLSQVRVYIAPYNWISNPPYYYWGSNSGAPRRRTNIQQDGVGRRLCAVECLLGLGA
jgi:subtilase family serine protease